jgi:hypothetical protein
VTEVVLANITNDTEADIIYNDPQYGMGSPKTITIWIAAYLEADGKYYG